MFPSTNQEILDRLRRAGPSLAGVGPDGKRLSRAEMNQQIIGGAINLGKYLLHKRHASQTSAGKTQPTQDDDTSGKMPVRPIAPVAPVRPTPQSPLPSAGDEPYNAPGLGNSAPAARFVRPNSQPQVNPSTLLYDGADTPSDPQPKSSPIPGAKPAPTQQAPQKSGQSGRNPGSMPITGQSWNTDPTTQGGAADSTIDYPDVNSTVNYGGVVDNGTPDVSSTINYGDIVGPPNTVYGGPQGAQNTDYSSDNWWLGNGMVPPDPTGAYNGTPVVDSTINYAGGGGDPSNGNDKRQYYDDYWGDTEDQYDSAYAKGGVATRPTHALVAEAGEDEYIVPESKLKPFADSVERGKPANPAKIKPTAKPQKGKTRKFAEGGVLDDAELVADDTDPAPRPPVPPPPPMRPPMLPIRDDAGDTPPPDAAPPRPPMLRAPGAPPITPAPAPTTDTANGSVLMSGGDRRPPLATPDQYAKQQAAASGQPPNPADYQGHGLGKTLRMIGAMGIGALAGASNAKGNTRQIDPTGAQRALLYPGYQQAKAQYDRQQAAQQAQLGREKMQAETGHLNAEAEAQRSTAEYNRERLNMQRNRFKFDPKTGAAFDTETGSFIQKPRTEIDAMNERDEVAKQKGWTEQSNPGVTQWIAEGKWGTATAPHDLKLESLATEILRDPKLSPDEKNARLEEIRKAHNILNPDKPIIHFATDDKGRVTAVAVNPADVAAAGGQKPLGNIGPTKQQPTQVGLTPEAIQQAAQLYQQTGQLPNLGMGASGAKARADILNQAGKSGADVAANKQEYRAQSGSLAGLQRQYDQVMAFEKTANSNLDIAANLSKQVDRTGSPLVNKWLLAAKGKIAGDADTRAFQAAVQTAVNEYAKVVTSNGASGSVTDTARKEYETILNAADNPQAFSKVVGLMKQEMESRKAGFESQLKDIRGRRGGAGNQPQPQTDEFLRTAVGAGGHKIGQKADGGWYDVETGQRIQ